MNPINSQYHKAKRLMDVLLDADRNDPATQLIRSCITLEDVKEIAFFIKDCEDMGVNLIGKRVD